MIFVIQMSQKMTSHTSQWSTGQLTCNMCFGMFLVRTFACTHFSFFLHTQKTHVFPLQFNKHNRLSHFSIYAFYQIPSLKLIQGQSPAYFQGASSWLHRIEARRARCLLGGREFSLGHEQKFIYDVKLQICQVYFYFFGA